jgi:hypothetical protein
MKSTNDKCVSDNQRFIEKVILKLIQQQNA